MNEFILNCKFCPRCLRYPRCISGLSNLNYTHVLSEMDMADTTGTAGNSIWSLFKLIFLWLFSFSMGSFHFESVFNYFPLNLADLHDCINSTAITDMPETKLQ